ncbi:HNH endonuclease [Brachybacterium sacelli]|uniref:HNH nuclease domain-containing protein n=1 Tax=Brachybacterium sacelli TaxID=173364 RepID=A0ABS4WWM2_9MICO|nr:HNH endonuclease [Brachybacterium sacelli]MBP2380551.1 hypothetical protein [Brachybacterium sacelli]
MSTTQNAPEAAEEYPNSSWSPEAVRAAGIDGLAQLLGDVGHLLEELAKDPGDLFETRGTARRSVVHLMHSEQVIRGAQDALEAHTVVALADVTRRDTSDAARDAAAHEDSAMPSARGLSDQADRIARRDQTLITRCSPSAAGSSLASARRLVSSMPTMFTALATRKVSAQVAYAVAGATSVLDDSQRREVDAMLGERLPYLDAAGVRDWRAEVAGAITELDPDGDAVRHRAARKARSLTLTPGQHGMANLTAHLPAIDAALLHKRISLEAERRRAEGAGEGHGALAADALVDTVLGRDDAMESVELDVGVIITDRALFRPDFGDVAQIAGYGPVPAEAVREQLRAATEAPRDREQDPLGEGGPRARASIRRLYTHPTSGELVAVESRGRAFPPALARFLTWRDTSCRGPFCNAQSRQSDHITPYSQGGPTTLDNGQDTCGHCNQKEEDTLHVERVEDPDLPGHRVSWTGHSGVTRVTSARPLVRPERPSGARNDGTDLTDRGIGSGDSTSAAHSSDTGDRIIADVSTGADDRADDRRTDRSSDTEHLESPGTRPEAEGHDDSARQEGLRGRSDAEGNDTAAPTHSLGIPSGSQPTARSSRMARRTRSDRERVRRLLSDRLRRRGSGPGEESSRACPRLRPPTRRRTRGHLIAAREKPGHDVELRGKTPTTTRTDPRFVARVSASHPGPVTPCRRPPAVAPLPPHRR